MNSTTLFPIVDGIILADFESHLRYEITNTVTNHEYIFTGFLQALQIDLMVNVALDAFQSLGRNIQVHWTAKAVLYVTPLLTSLLAKQRFANHNVQVIINFVHANLGTMASVVSLVALGVLFWQGQVLYVSATLAWSGVCALDNADYLPACISQVLQCVSISIYVYDFVIGNWIDKAIVAVFVARDLYGCFANPEPAV